MIYHITSKASWQQSLEEGFYEAESLHTEGFIHCSKQSQVPGVLDRYYKNQKSLLLLHINEDKIRAALKYELSPSVNEEFPHIYGPINIDAVLKTEEI